MIALLYYVAPNVRQPRFRWLSPGAAIAIITWLAASVGLSLFVALSPRFDRTYGALAGVIVVLLWLWLGNLALLIGAELDASIERARQLQGGLPAEITLQLPPRDTRASHKARRKYQRHLARSQQLRPPTSHRG